ncbi:MAG: hypothetical protein U5N27_19075 [Rhizobium sp.]|nr:hypothetical protein [Rhizobium sp.]
MAVDGTAIGLSRLQILHVALMVALVTAGHWLLMAGRRGRLCGRLQDPLAARLVGVDADRVFILARWRPPPFSRGRLSATVLYGTMDFAQD